MKVLVTHFSPDLDAVCSLWLIKRFLPGWGKAEIKFVNAGETWERGPVDANPEILHVDTGLGKFDHHQLDEDTCSAKHVLGELKTRNSKFKSDEALERLVEVVNDIDHFREVYFPNPTADFYDLGLRAALDGWRLLYADQDEKIVELGLNCLDGIYKNLQNKVWAERLLQEEGREFSTRWGKAVAVETTNDEVIHLAQKQGFVLVIRKDPKKGYVRIKALPDPRIDLTEAKDALAGRDSTATWFLHIGKHMILNGSSKNPAMRPTNLSLQEIIEILKN